MNPNFAAAVEEDAKCIKRQKLCATKCASALDSMIGMVEAAQRELEAGSALDPESVLAKLQKSIEDAGLFKEMNSSTKDFHSSIAKLGKALEKAADLDSDVCRALRPTPGALPSPSAPAAPSAPAPSTAASGAAAAAGAAGGPGAAAASNGAAGAGAGAASSSGAGAGSGAGEGAGAGAAAEGDDPGLLLARVIAEHFYREGRFELGDALAAEAGLMDGEALRAPYAAMHTVLEQIRAHNLEPALAWAVAHRPQLSPEGGPAAFEFRLHSLNFVHTLQSKGRTAALAYAKKHFGPHAARHLPQIQRLMGCLLFADRRPHSDDGAGHSPAGGGGGSFPGSNPAAGGGCTATAMQLGGASSPGAAAAAAAAAAASASAAGPAAAVSGSAGGGGVLGGGASGAQQLYADLLSPSGWDAAVREFAKQACSLMGQASESPLTTVVAAGSVALPVLLKLAAVMERNQQDLRAVEQLPVEIELGPEFVFRSIFACPVSRDMSAPDNPPMLLPCGHVLCEQSVNKLAKSRTRPFKCPYCPVEARVDALRPLIFPGID